MFHAFDNGVFLGQGSFAPQADDSFHHIRIELFDPLDGDPFDGSGSPVTVRAFSGGNFDPFFTHIRSNGFSSNYISLIGEGEGSGGDGVVRHALDNLAISIAPPIPGPSNVVTLLPRDSAWLYLDAVKNELHPAGVLNYPNDATGRAWNDPDFDIGTSADHTRTPPVDLPWQDDTAPFGAGTIDGATIATLLEGIDDAPGGESNDVTTYLFRGEFESPDPALVQQLSLNLLSDDGGILYVNGHEVFRTPNMGGLDPVQTTTLTHEAGSEFYVGYSLDAVDVLSEGGNSIAFELHQTDLTSSDVGFDLELVALVIPEPTTLTLAALALLGLVTWRRR